MKIFRVAFFASAAVALSACASQEKDVAVAIPSSPAPVAVEEPDDRDMGRRSRQLLALSDRPREFAEAGRMARHAAFFGTVMPHPNSPGEFVGATWRPVLSWDHCYEAWVAAGQPSVQRPDGTYGRGSIERHMLLIEMPRGVQIEKVINPSPRVGQDPGEWGMDIHASGSGISALTVWANVPGVDQQTTVFTNRGNLCLRLRSFVTKRHAKISFLQPGYDAATTLAREEW